MNIEKINYKELKNIIKALSRNNYDGQNRELIFKLSNLRKLNHGASNTENIINLRG
tara:strand:+ start:7713 stop:7880 length:168 start_codon:yes stop_codon:yes gene_type:complete